LLDVEVLHMATMGVADYSLPEYEGHFRTSALFIGGNVRKAVQEGRGDYTPIFLSEIEGLFTSGAAPIDVCLLQCTPPDHYGYMSLGVSVDVSLTAAHCARRVIVEINDQMPRTHGDTFLHVSRVDAFVETSHALAEYPKHEISDVHRTIARHVAPLIPDGATIQVGVGAIPQAIMEALAGHRDLGIHSLLVDHMLPLVERGVITNARKRLHRGRMDVTEIMGTAALFRWCHENPMINMEPSDVVHDPQVIGALGDFVSVNSAVEVDLSGQVNAESLGGRQLSGIGGQFDFVLGAGRAAGGRAIIALPATGRGGAVSRIVARFPAGTPVSTPRYLADYVVTEEGVASLRGKDDAGRARELLRVAHPAFREALVRERATS